MLSEIQLANLRGFGYTEVEARFLYLTATHSGYFTVAQFLSFAGARNGQRSARFVEKLLALHHASAQRYRRRSLVYHLDSRPLYDAIGKGHLRNRRQHELKHIKARLLALDFILAQPRNDYFETAEAKRQYFLQQLRLPANLFLSSNRGGEGITFGDQFPLYLASASPASLPVVTFTYIDSQQQNLDGFIAHLRMYRPLFWQLSHFRFIYVSITGQLQKQAALLFSLLVQGQGFAELIRYFDLRRKWDRDPNNRFTEQDAAFLYASRTRYSGDSFDRLYYLWKRKQLPRDLQGTVAALPHTIDFEAVTGRDYHNIFGGNAERWGDHWQTRGYSRQVSPQLSPATATEGLQSTTHR